MFTDLGTLLCILYTSHIHIRYVCIYFSVYYDHLCVSLYMFYHHGEVYTMRHKQLSWQLFLSILAKLFLSFLSRLVVKPLSNLTV